MKIKIKFWLLLAILSPLVEVATAQIVVTNQMELSVINAGTPAVNGVYTLEGSYGDNNTWINTNNYLLKTSEGFSHANPPGASFIDTHNHALYEGDGSDSDPRLQT